MTVTYKNKLNVVTLNHHVKYLGQSFVKGHRTECNSFTLLL